MNPRPVVYILGFLLIAMGLAMLPSALLDAVDAAESWKIFGLTGAFTVLFGVMLVLANRESDPAALTLRQAFILTTAVWVLLPLAGALPFMAGATAATLTDAYFEAVSGMTTTGATVFVGLGDLPRGILLWRGILQWLGGLGIVVVAMIFLPVMAVGGMQFFRTEGFDTLGKVMPRAFDIARSLLGVYVLLTGLCFAAYWAFGMRPFDAVVHALTTTSTGGFSTDDASFGRFRGPLEYVAVIFMILASLPFIRFVQLVQGRPRPLVADIQARAYLRWTAAAVLMIFAYRIWQEASEPVTETLRETLFNVVSLFSGTGFGSVDLNGWGAFPLVVLVLVGLIGGCTASTGCSIKVFRWLVAIQCIRSQIRQIRHPHAVLRPRLGAVPLSDGVIDSVMTFFTLFILTLGALAVGLSLSGLSFQTSITAAWTAIANVGPAFGPEVGPTGALASFPVIAKWLLVAGMLFGRLEIIAVYVLLLPRFWRG